MAGLTVGVSSKWRRSLRSDTNLGRRRYRARTIPYVGILRPANLNVSQKPPARD